MDRRQIVFGMTAMGVVGSLNLNQLLSAQSNEPSAQNLAARLAHWSNGERRELLGPVRMCVEETSSNHGKSVTTTEYAPDRKLVSTRYEMDGGPSSVVSSSEWVQTDVRDPQGRLEKFVYGKVGEPPNETLYTYDDSGRLLTFTNVGINRTEFHYAADGTKTSVQTFDPKAIERTRDSGFAGRAWEGTESGFGVPMGGSVTMTYDKNDNPIELQVHTADGQRVTRMVRTYDGEGRLIEERTLEKNRGFLVVEQMPPEQRAQMGPEEIRALSQRFNTLGKRPDGATYAYDSNGRVIKKCERNVVFECTTIIDYNQQGDKTRERQTFKENTAGLPHLPPDSDTRYTYQYDSYGNWTEKVETRDDGFTVTTRRAITYY